MNTTLRFATALFALLALAGTAVAAPPVQYWNDPVSACDHDRTLDRNLRSLQRAGFDLQNVEEQAIYYFVPPTGDFAWGTVTYTLTRGYGDMSLTTDYAVVTAEVTWYDGLGYKVSRISTEEYTVY